MRTGSTPTHLPVGVSDTGLDHVGLVGGDLAAMRAALQRLGFFLTPAAELQTQQPTTGVVVNLGQCSSHAVLQRGYLELTAVTSTGPQHHLAAYRHLGPGLQIVALQSADIVASHAACVVSKLPAGPIQDARREIDYGQRFGTARFQWFMLQPDAAPFGLMCWVNNLNPELVYQDAVMRHPNGAVSLEAVEICSQSAAPVQRIFSSVGATLAHRLHWMTPDAWCAMFGESGLAQARERFAAIVIRVADLAATAALLRHAGSAATHVNGRLYVPAGEACGAAIVFE